MLKPEGQKTTVTNLDLLLIMRKLKTKKNPENNNYFLIIMRNPEDHKATATYADLLLIMRSLKTKKQLQQRQIYF